MLVSFSFHTIGLQAFASMEQMLESLSNCEAGHLVLGEDAEYPQAFYAAIVHLGCDGLRCFGIGVCSEGHGLVPNLLLRSLSESLIVGFNSEVVRIDFPEGKQGFRLPLSSLFIRLLELPQQQMLLIQHEIGVVALGETGQVRWEFSKDIITNLELTESEVLLEFMDSLPVRLNLRDGTEY